MRKDWTLSLAFVLSLTATTIPSGARCLAQVAGAQFPQRPPAGYQHQQAPAGSQQAGGFVPEYQQLVGASGRQPVGSSGARGNSGSVADRVENVLANNPLNWAWSAMRGTQKPRGGSRPQVYYQQATVPKDDPIALNNPTGPISPELHISLAQMSERNGDIQQARNQYQQALALAPTNIDALLNFGRLEDRQARLPDAERLYRQAVAINPHNATALNDLALCLARQGRLDESVQLLEHAVAIQPDKKLFRNNIATVLVELQRDRDAVAHLTAVHGPVVANYSVGQLLTRRGRAAEAPTYFQAALVNDPSFAPAQQALAATSGVTSETTQVAQGPSAAPVPATQVPSQAAPQQQPTVGPGPGPMLQLTPARTASPYVGGPQAAVPSRPPYAPVTVPPQNGVPSPNSTSVPHVATAPQAPVAPGFTPRAMAPRYLPPVGGVRQ